VSAHARYAPIVSGRHWRRFRVTVTEAGDAPDSVPHSPSVYQQIKRKDYAKRRNQPKDPTRASEVHALGWGSHGKIFNR
jgi:hypothetical protein